MRANLLIHGDNLAALRSLHATHEGAVQLVYLDPPYNTGNTFDHYDDDVAHEEWLAFMRERLVAMVPLLAPDAVVLVQIDRAESAYLKVLLDEVFGRKQFVTTIAVRMSATSGFKIEHTDKTIVKNVEYLHVYSNKLRLLGKAYEENPRFDPHYGHILFDGGRRFRRLVHEPEVAAMLAAANLKPTNPGLIALYDQSPAFRTWIADQRDRVCRSHTAPAPAWEAFRRGDLLAGQDGSSDVVEDRTFAGTTYHLRRTRNGVDQLIPIRLKMHPVDQVGAPDRLALTNILGDWWDGFHLDMGNVEQEGGVRFKNGKKPERLLRRILRMFTREGEVVLDAFGGSGTTAAVAHKMGRRWITIEAGDQATSHIEPRLRRIIAGEDRTGVTAATGWTGGGDFELRTL